MGGTIPVIFWPGVVIAFALLFAFSWFLVRHIGLALLMVLSPLPGFVPAVFAGGRIAPLDYFPAFLMAAFLAGLIAPQMTHTAARTAAWQSFRGLWPVLLVIFFLLVPAAFVTPAPLCLMSAAISAVAVTLFGAMFLTFDEGFVVRINRANEKYLRQMERLNFLTLPRWGMSIGGITLVFAVLGFFGTQGKGATSFAHPALFAAMAFIFLVGTATITRNTRRTLATVLTMIPIALLTVATANRLAVPSSGLLMPFCVAAALLLFGAASTLPFERDRDGWETATLRGLERFGPTIAIASVASAAAAICLRAPAAILESAVLLLGGMAALILQPALTTLLYSLFPRRVSLEEAFRRG